MYNRIELCSVNTIIYVPHKTQLDRTLLDGMGGGKRI